MQTTTKRKIVQVGLRLDAKFLERLDHLRGEQQMSREGFIRGVLEKAIGVKADIQGQRSYAK